MKCMGGEIQGRFYPRNEEERKAAIDAGYDLNQVLTNEVLVRGNNCFFAATGVTDGELVRGVLSSLSYQIEDRDIEVEIGLLPTINGDRIQLEHVFGNLIDNSIKYMADRAPRAILIGST